MVTIGYNPQKGALRGWGGGLALIVGVLVLGYFVGSDAIEDTPPRPPPVAEEPEPERQNPLFLANLLCRQLVEDEAQYDFRWTDGLLGKKFEPVDALGGETVDFIGDEVELQNGFGPGNATATLARSGLARARPG